MMVEIKKWHLILILVFIIIISYLFWGPLFPWNPLKIGYQTITSSKATVYINGMTTRDSVVFNINEIVQQEEDFHGLTYVNDIKIIVLNKESNMQRYLPWLNGNGYSVSLGVMNVIYIGAIARKSPSGIEGYLKHELSHMLIAQNTIIEKGIQIHEQGWFSEGIAEYISGHSFYSKTDFLELCKGDNFQSSGLYEKSPLNMSYNELKFKYTYYRFFIEFLVDTYGLNKVQDYLKKYLDRPEDYKELFVEIYATDLDEILNKYKSMYNH